MRRRGWRAGRLRAEERPPGQAPAGRQGEPVPAELRARAEASLGVPLSTVRMHRDAEAARMAGAHGARALADGEAIMAGPSAGAESLAHELVHVAQRRRAAPARDGVSARDEPSEREARSLAPAVLAGLPTGGVRAAPSAALQRDGMKPDTSLGAQRRALSRRDLAGYAPASEKWEEQFAPQVLAPDPSVGELKSNYARRRERNPDLPDLGGIELAQAWAADLTGFKKSEARRYKIDQLLETMIRELPAEIWLPDDNVISQSASDKEGLTVAGTSGPYSPEPLRNKLYTLLVYIRDTKTDADPTGLIWDDELSWLRADEPGGQPEPFKLDYQPFTRIEDRALRLFFGDEMKEWSRRAVAVDESAAREKDRRGGEVTAGVAAASEKFVYVALGGSAAIGTGAALYAPAMGLWSSGTASLSNFSLSAMLRVAPRAGTWVATHPYATLGIATTTVNAGHDIYSGEFSPVNIPFYLMNILGGYQADRSNLGGGGRAPLALPDADVEASPPRPAPPPPRPAAPSRTSMSAPAADVVENVTDAPAPRPFTPSKPSLPGASATRNFLISLRMAVTDAAPVTAGTAGGGPGGGRPVPTLFSGGRGSTLPPLVDSDTAPGPTAPVTAAPAAPALAPAAVPVSAGGASMPTIASPIPAPLPSAASAQDLTATPTPATATTAAQQGVAPNVEGQMGISQDQRGWLAELFGGNFTSGLRDILGTLWDATARPGDVPAIARTVGRRARYRLATYYYNLHRARFLRAVRRSRDARALFDAAGAQLGGSTSSAPVIILPGGRRLEITIDHIVQRSDNPLLALDPDNLRLSTRRENTVELRLLNVLDAFIDPPPWWLKPNWTEPDDGPELNWDDWTEW